MQLSRAQSVLKPLTFKLCAALPTANERKRQIVAVCRRFERQAPQNSPCPDARVRPLPCLLLFYWCQCVVLTQRRRPPVPLRPALTDACVLGPCVRCSNQGLFCLIVNSAGVHATRLVCYFLFVSSLHSCDSAEVTVHDSSIKCDSRTDDRLKLKTQIKFRPNKDRHKTEDTIDVWFIPPQENWRARF